MPIPIAFIAIGAGTAAIGVGNSIKAGFDQNKAEETNGSAESIIKHASEKMEFCRRNCGEAIENLAICKVSILNESIRPFIQEFQKIQNIELEETKELYELQKQVLNKKSFAVFFASLFCIKLQNKNVGCCKTVL